MEKLEKTFKQYLDIRVGSFEGYLQREFHILWDWTRNLDAIKRAVRDWQRGVEINKEQ